MKEEASDTTMLAVTVIALAVVVAVAFGIFQYARSILNVGNNNLTSALDGVSSSQYSDYDDKVLAANQVTGAFQNFQGTKTAILVRTKAFAINKNVIASKADNTADRYLVNSYIQDGTTPKQYMDTVTVNGSAQTQNKVFVNYNAILAAKDGKIAAAGTTPGEKYILLNDGTYRFSFGFYAINGTVQFYNTMTNINRQGTTEYIASGSKFQGNLIKDDADVIVGVVFDQTLGGTTG